jgi:hypothetical protein
MLSRAANFDRKIIEISNAEHHHLQAVDKLCPPTAIKNDVCTVQSKDIRLTYDFVYTSAYDIVFDNTEVQCVTTTMLPCTLHLRLSRKNSTVTMMNASKFVGKQVILDAPYSRLTILDNSFISVSG